MSDKPSTCRLCGEPMPPGEEMFKYHGYSGPCPKPPLQSDSPPKLRVCIAIDDWKLPTFTRLLKKRGYTVEVGAGLSAGTTHLYVETDDAGALAVVVRECQRKAAELKN